MQELTMKNRFLCAVGACLAAAGVTLAQAPVYQPARSFPYTAPPVPYLAYPAYPGYPAPAPVIYVPVPVPVPVQAVHKEPARPGQPSAVKRASDSEVIYQPMPSDPTQLEMPQQLPLSQFHDVVGPVTMTDTSAADAIDGQVFAEGAVPGGCGDGRRAWISGEALMWWVKDSPIAIPLVTRSTVSATPQPTTTVDADGNEIVVPPANLAPQGSLGQSGTQFLAGSNADLDSGQRFGGKIAFGYWVNDAMAFEIGGFFLTQGGTSFAHVVTPNASGTDDILARPYLDVNTGQETALIVAAPNFADGRFDLSSSNRLWGLEGNAHVAVLSEPNLRVNVIAGLRYVDLQDDLTVSSTSYLTGNGMLLLQALPAGPPETIILTDIFRTRNRWMGGQVGIQGGVDYGAWFFNGAFKIGGGANKQELLIAGSSSNNNFADNGGLLALPTNIGEFGRTRLSFLNETVLEMGYRINERIAVSAGYTFLYLTGVVRAGDQLERRINSALIPSQIGFNYPAEPRLPMTQMDQTDFWAQGIQLGLSVRY